MLLHRALGNSTLSALQGSHFLGLSAFPPLPSWADSRLQLGEGCKQQLLLMCLGHPLFCLPTVLPRPVGGLRKGTPWGDCLPTLAVVPLNSSTSLPHIISRMGKLEQVDVNLFCLVATDFYRHQIEEEFDHRAFQSVFEVVAAPGSPYHRLLACLRNVHKVTTC